MTSVETLEVKVNRARDPVFHPLKLTILERGWSAYRSNLQKLVLNSYLEDVCQILQLAPKLPQLEDLCIFFKTLFRTSCSDELIQGTILPFIEVQLGTIKTLTLDASSEILDLTSLLRRLSQIHMPSLTKFNLYQILLDPELTYQAKFLETHRHQLKGLSLGLHFTKHNYLDFESAWFEKLLWEISFSNLNSLRLNLTVPGFHAVQTRFLKRYIRTLRSVEICRWHFDYNELSSVFADTQECRRLRNLSLRILILTPDIFRLFAENLPGLRELKLDVHSVLPVEGCLVPYNERINAVGVGGQLQYDLRTDVFESIM